MASRRRTVPTSDDTYALRHAEAVALKDVLRGKGYRADVQHSGACSTIDGEHIHLNAVIVTLTPAQARRLAGLPKENS